LAAPGESLGFLHVPGSTKKENAMLAMTYLGPSRVKAVKKPEPRIEHPNDVILRVTRAAICGSDLHLYHGFVPDTRVGCTFGHEFTGVVVERGAAIDNFQHGDRVVVPFNISCGSCFFCSRQLFGNCSAPTPAPPSPPASTATATAPAATTAARPSSCGCPAPTWAR